MPPDVHLEYHEDVAVPGEVVTDPGLPQTPLLVSPQLEVASLSTTNTPRGKESFSVLARIPLDIQEFRERVFSLEEPVSFDQQTWERYWPYIDNVWCLHNRMDADMGLNRGQTEKYWGGCRLQRKWDHQTSNPPPKGIRNRVRRATGTCNAKFKLTVNPDGSRILERSTGGGHLHNLDHIDSIKRNTGVRSLVLDPFFNSWEPATIMAYLKDEDHRIEGRDMLTEAGGKYLERREIMNIFSQHLRKLYPGLDVSSIKKEQDKYKMMKTCNYKGCNRSFSDGKALMAHRKSEHPIAEGRKHDHTHRQYTCPERGCHRKKKSKGFPSQLALREHQIKMEHWGFGTFHGEDGPVPCDEVQEGETLQSAQTTTGAAQGATRNDLNNENDDMQVDDDGQSSLSVPQRSLPNPDHTFLPLIAQGVSQLEEQQAREAEQAKKSQQVAQAQQAQSMMPIDPAMQSTPMHNNHRQQQQSTHGDILGLSQATPPSSTPLTNAQRLAAMERYHQLQLEMAEIQNRLYS